MAEAAVAPHLSPAQIESYRRDGLIIPDYRLARAQLDTLRVALEALLVENTRIRPEQLISAHIRRGPEKTVGQDAFLDFAHDPHILDLVEQLIGPDLVLWGCQVFCKPAGTGYAVPWHQDGRYWPIRPLATCTVWVALDDSMPQNGCMRYIPGSHANGHMYRHRRDASPELALDLVLADEAVDMNAARDVVLESGRMSLHDVFLVHGSNPNRSGERRAGLALRYMPATSHFDRAMFAPRTTESGLTVDYTNRPIWLVRGQDRAGNDLVVGKA